MKALLAGLEVRVAFGEVWKESLTELSGGQRSLLALSLILAMLLFKPAPIYILDEVKMLSQTLQQQPCELPNRMVCKGPRPFLLSAIFLALLSNVPHPLCKHSDNEPKLTNATTTRGHVPCCDRADFTSTQSYLLSFPRLGN